MKTKKTTKTAWRRSNSPSVPTLTLVLLCVLWTCSDPHPEYANTDTREPYNRTPAPPESDNRPGVTFTDTTVWRESATASFTNLGVVDPDFRYEAAQHVRFSIIRFQLFFPAEVEISHCGSNLASTTLLLLDSVRQTLISSMDGSPPTVACSRPTLGLLRVAAQAGVYYAVGCVAGTVQVDVSKLLGATSPAIISMQTTAVTGTLRTDITCSPLPAE